METARNADRVTVRFNGILTEPRLDHPESVAVAPDGSLWCGGEAGQVFRIAEGEIETIANTGGFILGVAFDARGNLYACDIAHRQVWHLDVVTRELTAIADTLTGHELLTPNAVLPLPDGSVLVSDSGNAHEPRTGLVRFHDGQGSVWLEERLDFANGLAASPDWRRIYVAETWAHRVSAIDLDDRLRPVGPPYSYCELPGYLPDGLAVAEDGILYVGCYEPSAVLRVSGAGRAEVLAQDDTAHELCHPTGVAVCGNELVVANLGRWHLSSILLDAGLHE
jgi:sugar lactone lactonase YvrE